MNGLYKVLLFCVHRCSVVLVVVVVSTKKRFLAWEFVGVDRFVGSRLNSYIHLNDPLFNVKSGAESEASELRFSSTPRQFGIRSEREQVL
jgi:hypothetical protein